MSKKLSEPKIIRRKISDYTPDTHNANAGNERGLQMVEKALNEVGAGRSIVVDGEGRIVAGNKTMEAAQLAGIEEMIEITTKGDAIIVHKREDWDLNDPSGPARQYAYIDNRANEVGLAWDANQIAADVAAGVDMSGMFSKNELDAIMNGMQVVDIDASSVDISSQYLIMIECAGEFEQSKLLEKLIEQGVKCRALVS